MDSNMSSNSRRADSIEFEKLEGCPYCSSKDIFLFLKTSDRMTGLPGEFSLFKCKRCGLVFQNPRVKEKYISLYYSEDYYRLVKKQAKKSGLKRFLIRQTLINHFGYKLGKRNSLLFLLSSPLKRVFKIQSFPDFRTKGKLLEVGCSSGHFLEKMKGLGWVVRGVEINKRSAEFATKERGLSVQTARIEECHFREQGFDAIIMSMVLEHLYQPFKILQRLTLWLKKDGQLIFSLPYFQGFEFGWFREYCYGLQLPTHITFFNKRVLRDCLKKLGYRKVKFYHQFFDRDVVTSSQYKYQSTKSAFYKLIAYNKMVRILLIKPLVFFASLVNATSRVTVYAEK